MPRRHAGKLAEVRAFCEAHANPANVKKYSRYFTEGYDAFGLDQETLHAQAATWLERWGGELGLAGFLDLGDALVRTGKYEEASFAYLFARAHKEQFEPGTLERIGRWFDDGICNWGHTDLVSSELVAPFVVDGLTAVEALAGWRDAASKWKRRAVPVSLIALVKAGRPLAPLLGFVEPLMGDGDRFVQQGLGWFLREAWKRESKPVEAFLGRWKDTCARTIVQYATEKMPPAKKARFKRARAAARSKSSVP